MNKIISKYLAILFIIGGIFSQTIMVSASCMTEVTVEAELDDITINERTVNTTETISLNAGNTWKKRFKTSKLIGTDHDAFSVKVTGVSGSYKVQIMGGEWLFL